MTETGAQTAEPAVILMACLFSFVAIVPQLSKCLKFEAVWGGIKLIK